MSGVHVEDVAGMIVWSLENERLQGAVNAVMPEAFRNVEFTRELARAVKRPAIFPAPAFALRVAFGELADSMLASARVMPCVAREGGYGYQFATLPSALAEVTN
jgi:NAD dependent epimerase/dehydratase family enzyme